MREHLRRNLLLGLALVAVLAGVIIAVSGQGTKHTPANARRLEPARSGTSEVALAASYLGISPATLRRRLRQGETMAEIAGSTPGRSTGGLIAALARAREAQAREAALAAHRPLSAAELARVRAQIVAEANRGRGRSGAVSAAAAYLGLSDSAVRARLRAGQSLAEIAAAVGRSRAGLIEALVALKASRLRTAVSEHAITAAEEKAALATLSARVKREVGQRQSAPAR